MDNRITYAALLALLLSSSIVWPIGDKLTISSPADGAVVKAGQTFRLAYEANPGTDGDYLHLNVDGERVDIIHRLRGSVEIVPLSPGKHKVCLAISTPSHVQIGAATCINVASK